MKFLLPVIALGLFAANGANAFPLGAYKAIDAYCTNPNYKYSKEEQDFIDSLKGQGSCRDGNMRSFPCYEDYYIFTTATEGALVTKTSDVPGVSCVTTTSTTYTLTPPSTVDILLGKTTSRPISNNPDVEISCEENNEGNHLVFNYKQDGEFLLLTSPGGDDCGDYVFKTKSVPAADVPN